MKRIYNALSIFMLLFLLLVGLISTFDKDATFSESEKRQLKSRPKFTISGFLDGNFFVEYREYFADTFPNRENLKEHNTKLNAFYYFSGLSGENSEQLVINFDSNAAQHGQSLKDPDATTPSEATTPTEQEDIPKMTEPQAAVEQLGNVIVVGDRAMDVPYGDNAKIKRYAQAVNGLAELLGTGVKTWSMPVPNAAEFYAGSSWNTGHYSQKAMFQTLQENLSANVTYVDAYSEIAKHTDEYIYFRTDHHWTHLGAYYAYTALCKSAGVTAPSRTEFATGQWDNFVGSMYTYIANYPQAAILKENPDTVHYWKPNADCTTYYYSDTNLSDGVLMGTICKIREEVENKYLTFMGGDHPVTIVTTDTEGPCILVIKESYGNALISWLTNNYSKIILIDPREYFDNRSDIDLKAFAESQGVDELLVINYPMMLNSENYIALLEKLAK